MTVQHLDIEQPQGGAESLGDAPVGTAGLATPEGWLWANITAAARYCSARMATSGIHRRAVEGTENKSSTQHLVLAIEKDAAKHLPVVGSQVVLEKARSHRGWTEHRWPAKPAAPGASQAPLRPAAARTCSAHAGPGQQARTVNRTSRPAAELPGANHAPAPGRCNCDNRRSITASSSASDRA